MNRVDLQIRIAVILLLLPSLVWAWWSFKLYKNAFAKTRGDDEAPSYHSSRGSELLPMAKRAWGFGSGSDASNAESAFNPQRSQAHALAELVEHSGAGILGTGVCVLGKIGAWVILLWSLTVIALLFALPADKLLYVGIAHCVVLGTIFGLSAFMNFPLWVRTLPYFVTQVGVCILLLTASQTSSC